MKALLFIIGTFFIFTTGTYAQDRNCNLSLRVVSPTDNYSVPFGDTIDVIICIKNNGPDSVLRTDTLLIGMIGSNIYSAMLDTVIAPGDSLVWSIMSGFAYPDQEENDTLYTCLFLEHLPYYTDSFPDNDSTCFTAIFEGSKSNAIVSKNNIKELNIYPNPNKGIVNITSQNAIKSIEVINLMGKIEYVAYPNKSQCRIDISQLPPSLYFLNIKDNEGRQTIQKIQKHQ